MHQIQAVQADEKEQYHATTQYFLSLLFSVETPGGPSLFGGQVGALLCPTMQCLSEANMFYCKVNLGKHLSQKPKCYTGVFCMTQAETI